MLALLLILAQTPQPRLFLQPNMQRQVAGLSPFVLSETFDFAGGAVSQPPACTGDAHCVAFCTVTSTPDWQCFDNTGALIAGMTQGTGAVYENSIWHGPDGGWFQEEWVDDSASAAAVPRINSAAIRNIFAGNHTIVTAGFWTGASTWWAMITDGTNQMQLRASGSLTEFLDGNAGQTAQVTGSCASSGRCVVSGRRNGANIIARAQGTQTTVAGGTTAAITGSNAFYFGGVGGCCTPAGRTGASAWVVIYDEAKSDAWMVQTEKNIWGAPTVQSGGNGTVGTAQGSLIGRDDLAWPSGGVSIFAPGAYISDPTLGLRHQAAFTNSWATDPLAAATWTDVGTPVVTSNASAGPFYAWKHTNECDLIADDDGAAFEGKRSATVAGLDGGPGGWFNASCYLKAGTSGTTTTKARISFTHDGVMDAGSATCDVTGLSSTAARYPLQAGCWAWIDGATSVKANVLVGNAAAETGSVTVCQCQLTQTLFPEAPTVDNTGKGANWPELDGGGVPFGNTKGKLQAVFYPSWTSTQPAPLYTSHGAAPGGISQYVLDAYHDGASHDVLLLLTTFSFDGGLGDPGLEALMYGPSETYENRFDVPYPFGPVVDAGVPYIVSYEWRPSAGTLPDAGSGIGCRGLTRFDSWTGVSASTVIAQNNGQSNPALPVGPNNQNTGNLGTCPLSTDIIDIGTRQQGSSPTTGWVRKMEIYQ